MISKEKVNARSLHGSNTLIADLQDGGSFRQNDDPLVLSQVQCHPASVEPRHRCQLGLVQRDVVLRPGAYKFKKLYVVLQGVARGWVDPTLNWEGLRFSGQISNMRTRETDTFNVILGGVRIGLNREVELEVQIGPDEIRLQEVVV